jgi:hypothetical protein
VLVIFRFVNMSILVFSWEKPQDHSKKLRHGRCNWFACLLLRR